MIIPDKIATIEELEEALDLTKQRIGQLVEEGVIVKASRGKYQLRDSLLNYIRFLRDRSQARGGDSVGAEDYEKHRARLYSAKADKAIIEADLMKGKVHEAELVEDIWDGMIANAKTKLLALPSKAAPQIQGVEQITEIKSILETIVFEALQELSCYDPSKLIHEFLEKHQQEVDSTEEVDGESVGGP